MARSLLDGLAVVALVAAGAWLLVDSTVSGTDHDPASPLALTEALAGASVRPEDADLVHERVILGRMVRPTVVAQVPARIDLRLDWVPRDSLRVSIGARRVADSDATSGGTVGFEISATDPETEQRTVVRKRIRLGVEERASGWQELQLDLGPLRGRPLLLRFWARGDGGLEACWGDPVLSDDPGAQHDVGDG